MAQLKRHLILAGVFVTLAVASLILTSRGAVASVPPVTAPVSIVSPLPLPVTGTVTVSGVPTSTTIDNSASNPVPVRDVDAVTHEPFQARTPFSQFTSGVGTVTLVTVPADKTLVIEHVSAAINDTSGSGLVSCDLETATLNGPVDWVVCEPMGKNALNAFYAANAQTKFVAGPGSVVRFGVSTVSFSGTGFVAASVSGYYIPAP